MPWSIWSMVTSSTPASSNHCFWNWAMVRLVSSCVVANDSVERPRVLRLVLGDEILRLGHVLRQRVAGVCQVSDLVGRERPGGQLTDAGADGVDDRLLVGRIGKRAANADVLERRAVLRHVQRACSRSRRCW